MYYRQLTRNLLFALSILLCSSTYAKQVFDQKLYDIYPYAFTYYYGISCTDALSPLVLEAEFHRFPEHIQSVELAKTLDKDNILRRIVNPLVGVVQIAGNITLRQGRFQSPKIYEFDPYLAFRWANLPWNDYLVTSFAIGEGLSYVTAIPALERNSHQKNRKLLNYLMLEATFALPMHPQLQLILRVHHRSGAYGLFQAGNTGSNVVGLGVRYLFD